MLDFTYSFDADLGAGVVNNGNVMSIANNRDTNRSQSFTYDALNRIATAKTQATTGPHCWGETFGYDIWANLLTIAAITPTYNGCTQENLSVTATTSNRISGLSYDLAGNLLSYGGVSYTWDAESRMKTAAGVAYTYDGEGKRVKKSNGKLYWYGIENDTALETDLAGNTPLEFIFFDDKRIARRDAGGAVSYFFSDHLGSGRVVTNSTGGIVEESDFYPFGGERAVIDALDNQYKFTGKERDLESGIDYFLSRMHSSAMGRFLSPDPDQESGFLYMDDPQAWNGYPYARNNPLNLTDPTGRSYEYCTQDEEGKYTQCNTVSDPQHAAAVKEGVNTFKDGKIFDGDTQIATYRQIDVDLPGDPEANRQAAGMIVERFDDAMTRFGENAAYAAAGGFIGRGIGIGIEALAARTASTGSALAGAGATGVRITFGHGARHLVGSGLAQDVVEAAIRADIQAATNGASATGSFWGRVLVNGKEVFYRAFTRPDGTINVGTYTVGAP